MSNTLVSYPAAFQKSVVRLLMQDPHFLDVMSEHLQPSFFENTIHRWFAQRMMYLRQAYGSRSTLAALDVEIQKAVASRTLVPEELPKYLSFLERLEKAVPDSEYVKSEIMGFLKRQKQRNAILKASELFESGRPSEEIDAVMVNAAMFSPKKFGRPTFIGPDLKSRIRRRLQVLSAIPTGIELLDEQFDHRGIPNQFLGVVLAPSHRGKTKFLIKLGTEALRVGKKVLHITLEEPKDSVLDCYDSALTGIPLKKLKKKPKTLKKMWADFGSIGSNLVVIEDVPGSTVNTIRSHLRELGSLGFVPDLIILDYADEMLPVQVLREKDNTYTLQGQVYSELNALLRELNIPCWTAAQGTRGSLSKETLDFSDMGESLQKVKKAFIILALCQTPAEQAANLMRVVVLKNRDGVVGGEIHLKIDHAAVQYVETSEKVEERKVRKIREKGATPIKQPPKGKWAELLNDIPEAA